MTERSFRTPSPNRSSAPPVEADPSAPPVPSLPQTLRSEQAPHRRASSMDPPMRSSSPPRQGGRGMSVDGGSRVPHTDRRAASHTQLPQVETGARRSVNFSRPMSPPATPPVQGSPVSSKASSTNKAGRSGWYTASVSAPVQMRQDINDIVKPIQVPTSFQTHQVEQSLQNTANRPVAKKKRGTALPPEGSRLSQANRGMETSKYAVRYDPNTRTIQRVPTDSESEPEITSSLAAKASEGASPTTGQPLISSSLAAKIERGTSPTVAKVKPLETRPSATLTKRPSVVREEREEEEQEEEPPSKDRLRAASLNLGQPKPINPVDQHTRSVSLQPSNAVSIGRSSSSPSPSRNAHFADRPVLMPQGVKHDPPARSLSPAKPALKHSPASSIRTSSPAAPRAPASDVSISGSEEGSRKPGNKKSARVSFGDEVEIPEIPPTTGLTTSKYAERPSFENDSDFEMSPRPELPSFGSVRGRSRQAPPAEPIIKVTETVPSSVSTSISTLPPLEHSSDHALGGILKDDLTRQVVQGAPAREEGIDPNEPLPPEVTSVEGTGYVSDPDSSSDEDIPIIAPEPARHLPVTNIESKAEQVPSKPALSEPIKFATQEPLEPVSKEEKEAQAQGTMPVPDIAIQPATPAATEEADKDEWAFVMPGGFAGSWEDEPVATIPVAPTEVKEPPPSSQSVEPPVASASGIDNSQLFPETIHEEGSSDGDSIYSDAEEELSDRENFASLDAIVESPIVQTSTYRPTTPPKSPLREALDFDASPTDWNETKAYWSGLSEKRKQELERQAEAQRTTEVGASPLEPQKRRKKKAATAAQLATTIEPEARPRQKQHPAKIDTSGRQRVSRESQGSPQKEEHHMRKSMRGPPPEPTRETHMRQSMRTGAFPTSMRGSVPGGGLGPSKWGNQPAQEHRGALQKKNIAAGRPATAGAAGAGAAMMTTPMTMPALVRSDSSASDSSFKRLRPTSVTSDGERYNMRRTMRGSSGPQRGVPAAPRPAQAAPVRTLRPSSPPERPATATAGSSKRFSLRSLSPPARRAPRNASLDITPTQRPQTSGTLRESKSPTRFSLFNREPKAKAPAAALPKPGPPKAARPTFKSRFSADSADSSPAARTKFTSRFADSDDDDDSVADLTPVRGIPRRPGEEDRESTDLEDESGDEPGALQSPKRAAASSSTDIQTEGTALAAGSMRGLSSSKHAAPAANAPMAAAPAVQTPKKEKRSFFGLGPRKRTASVDTASASSTPLKAQQILGTSSPAQPRSPKLQRRSTPQSLTKLGSDQWPLPPPPAMKHLAGEEDRPNTSDGAPVGADIGRPDMGNRRSTVDGANLMSQSQARELRFDEGSIVSANEALGRRTTAEKEKKKKFGMLRKAFKLND